MTATVHPPVCANPRSAEPQPWAPQPISVCIVSHNAYGTISGAGGHIGGVELQTTMTARWLAARGHRVHLLTWDEGGHDGEVLDGVRVHAICRRRAGLPGLRFFWPRWTGLLAAMRRADADVYYHNCAEYVTGQAAMWCRRNGRGFVFSSANDTDVDPRLPELRTIRERVLYRYGIRHADALVVQTQSQRRSLLQHFGRAAEVIPMPAAGPSEADYTPPRPPGPGSRVLWAARLARQKRPDRLLKIAAACPELKFDFVGPLMEPDYAGPIVEQARRMPNVTVHGPADRASMQAFYRNSACLLNTSDYDGFPNTFLEAWSHGLPLISTFDPDGIVVRHGLGAIAKDSAGLAVALQAVLGDPSRWQTASTAARRYYVEHHTLEAIMPQYEHLFIQAAAHHGRVPA